jgi:hypothetical protein
MPDRSLSTMRTWLLCLLVASTAGLVLTALAMPAGQDIFESPLLGPYIAVVCVLCALAGWFAPAGGRYWGWVAAVPYLLGFWVLVALSPREANLAVVGWAFLLVLTIVPWLFGWGASRARRARG